MVEIARLIYKYLPQVKTIGGYARVDNLKNKTVEQLKHLFELGYCYFYFGMESGDDNLLKRMNKGYKSNMIVEQCKKMDEAGMPYIGNFLGGLGGHNYGLSHARESARVINQLKPAMSNDSRPDIRQNSQRQGRDDSETVKSNGQLRRRKSAQLSRANLRLMMIKKYPPDFFRGEFFCSRRFYEECGLIKSNLHRWKR